MRDLFNLALMDEINEAKYAVIELQFQVNKILFNKIYQKLNIILV